MIEDRIREIIDKGIEKIQTFLQFGRGKRIEAEIVKQFLPSFNRETNFFTVFNKMFLEYLSKVDKDLYRDVSTKTLENLQKIKEEYINLMKIYLSDESIDEDTKKLALDALFDSNEDIDSVTGQRLSDMYFDELQTSPDPKRFIESFIETYKERIFNRMLFNLLFEKNIDASREADLLKLYFNYREVVSPEEAEKYVRKIIALEEYVSSSEAFEPSSLTNLGAQIVTTTRQDIEEVINKMPARYAPAGRDFVVFYVPDLNKSIIVYKGADKTYGIELAGDGRINIYQLTMSITNLENAQKVIDVMNQQGYFVKKIGSDGAHEDVTANTISDYMTRIEDVSPEEIFVRLYGYKKIDMIIDYELEEYIRNVMSSSLGKIKGNPREFFTYLVAKKQLEGKRLVLKGKNFSAISEKLSDRLKNKLEEIFDDAKILDSTRLGRLMKVLKTNPAFEEFLDKASYRLITTKKWRDVLRKYYKTRGEKREPKMKDFLALYSIDPEFKEFVETELGTND
ncbi:MAG: hypothetical protein QXG36_07515 [Nitrososphaeria archaeon]